MLSTTKKILDWLENEWGKPYPPTVAEIASALGHSTSTIHAHLTVLADMACISWEPGKARTIVVVKQEGSGE